MRPLRSLPWWLAFIIAAAGGFLLDVASPAVNWWPAGIIGAVGILASIWHQRMVVGFIAGALAGASFWLPHISWLTLYLGPIPWLALCSVMVVWFALFGALAAFCTRTFGTLRVPMLIRLLLQACAVAGLWVAREQVQSTWPYGGFAWGRLAHTTAESPLVDLVSWTGVAGLSGLLVLTCGLLVGLASMRVRTVPMVAMVGGVTIAVLGGGMLIPAAQLDSTGMIRVAAVQGNSKSGIFDDRENGDVFRDHLDATQAMLDELERTGKAIDVIVWPENSAEFQVTEQYERLRALRDLSRRADAPIVVGTILFDDGEVYTNSAVVVSQNGSVGGRYDKRRPVPFAEYMPNRAFFHALVPELVDLVQLDYAFGERSSVVTVSTGSGNVRAGIAICFDIIFDDHAVAMSKDGAEIIFAITNNADFGETDESAQQLQIARLRAVETGRSLVNISTVGTSAIIAPDGTDLDRLTPFTADWMVAEVPLVTGKTPALTFGSGIAAGWMSIGLGSVLAAIVVRLVRRRER